MLQSASDQELQARQMTLQTEARDVLAELDRCGLFDETGPPLLAGSYVSGLMIWTWTWTWACMQVLVSRPTTCCGCCTDG
jgi:hypothetical protein